MKKIFFPFAVLAIVTHAQSEPSSVSSPAVRFGFRAGVSMEWQERDFKQDFEDYIVEMDALIRTRGAVGGYGGVVLDIKLLNFLYLQPGVIFSEKEWKTNIDLTYPGYEEVYMNAEMSWSLYYLEVPIMLSLKGTFTDNLALVISAGPCISIGLSGTYTEDTEMGYYDEVYPYLYRKENETNEVKDVFSPTAKDKQYIGKGYEKVSFGVNFGAGIEYRNHFYLGVNRNMGLSNISKDKDRELSIHSLSFTAGYNF